MDDPRLQTDPNVWLSTTRPTGKPHLVPIWFIWLNERFYICTESKSVKIRNLRHNAGVCVALEDGNKPVIAEGQRHGGIAQGVGQALLEQVSYDADGNPQSANFADYLLPSAAELPSFELGVMETPTPLNPLGAKGIGESGTIGATPAVQNAVVDALSAYGVRHVDMPLSPERVWRALQAQPA